MIQIFVIFNYHEAIHNRGEEIVRMGNDTEEEKIINNMYTMKSIKAHTN